MEEILKITEFTALSFHVLGLMAEKPGKVLDRGDFARMLGASENHLSKVLQRLAHEDFIKSSKGPSGGYRLARDPKKIRLIDVYEAMEGKFKPGECLLDKPVCPRKKCVLGGLMEKINQEVGNYLKNTRVSDLAQGNGKE